MNLEKTGSNMATLPKSDINTMQETEVVKRSTVQTNQQGAEKESKISTSPQEIELIVEKLNNFIDPSRTNLKFVLHEDLNKYYVEVVNPFTDEVVKEIPPKKMLDMYAAMAEFMGLLVDEKI